MSRSGGTVMTTATTGTVGGMTIESASAQGVFPSARDPAVERSLPRSNGATARSRAGSAVATSLSCRVTGRWNSKLAWADRLIAVISPDYIPARYSRPGFAFDDLRPEQSALAAVDLFGWPC